MKTEQKQSHATVPWGSDFKGRIYSGLYCIAETFDGLRQNNAAFIVKSVNNHQRLVDALKLAENYMSLVEKIGSSPTDYDLLRDIRKLLKELEQE